MSPAQDNAISMLTLARKSGRTELTAHLRVPGTAGASLPNLTSSPWILGAGYHHPSLIEGETGIVRKWAKGPRPLSNWASQLCSGWLSKPTCSLMVLCCRNSLYKHCLSTVLLGWTAKSKSFTVTPSTPTSSISKFCWKRPLSIQWLLPTGRYVTWRFEHAPARKRGTNTAKFSTSQTRGMSFPYQPALQFPVWGKASQQHHIVPSGWHWLSPPPFPFRLSSQYSLHSIKTELKTSKPASKTLRAALINIIL